MKVDGRVYVNEGVNPVMGMNTDGSYWCMGDPDGISTNWIRTTSLGIIPYQSGGSSSLGTASWPFNSAYINTVYGNLSGNSNSATYLMPHNSAVTYTSSTWGNMGTNVWGMAFRNTALGSDTGDIGLSLTKYSDSQVTLNLKIDGQISAGSARSDGIGFIGNLQGNATTATYLNVVAANEIRFNNFNYNSLWFNHVQPDGATNPTACTDYYFGDGQRQYSTVTLHAGQFSGNAATATKLATARTISLTGSVTGSGSFDGSGNLSIATTTNHSHNNIISSGTKTMITGTSRWPAGFTVGDIYTSGYPFSYGSTWMYQGTFGAELIFNGLGGDAGVGTGHMYFRTRSDWATSTWGDWKKLWCTGDSVTGAVWNDYAEYRESDCKEFGYVLTEKGDDTLTKTTERLQPFAGVSSDTWGFCQGETEKAKTPIAVAGRVLVYTYRDRNNYKPGDVVCAAPNGTIDIMTREEVINYPDRIVGTVSCVPEYDTWGSGDRDPVKVNGRIWIKVV